MAQEVKPGWKTSEFWISLLTMAGGIAAALGAPVDAGGLASAADQVVGGVVAGAAALGYTVSRGLAKRGG